MVKKFITRMEPEYRFQQLGWRPSIKNVIFMVSQFSPNFSHSSDNNFIISDYLDVLTPSPKKEKGKYICPNCNGHNLSINKGGVKYDCYNCGDKSEIAKKLYLSKHGQTEKKKAKPQGKHEYIYTSEGKPYIKVIITYDENGKKKPPYQKRYENGKWINSLGDNYPQSKADLFHLDEVNRAIASNELIFITEGEGCVESLRKLGLTATTNIGGSGKNYECYKVLKDYPNLVLCPDRDKPGLKHMETIEGILNHKPMWFYVPSHFWHNLPEKDGIDIADFIIEKKDKLTNDQIKEMIMGMIEDKKEFASPKKTESKVVNFPTKPIDKSNIQSRLSELLEKNLSPSQENIELLAIARDNGINPNDLEKIYRSLKDENESEELTIDLNEKLENILDIENINLDLSSVLPQEIAVKLIALSQKMKVAPEHLLTAMLPTWASMIGTKSKIVISSAMGYTQPSILRTMIVANSGDRKSPILKNATNAIVEMDIDSMSKFKQEMKDYEEAVKLLEKGDTPPDKPTAKRFVIDDFNYDGMVKLHSENEVGLLGIVDELKGYFTRMNKQTGKGDDEQKDLQLFNGSPLIKDRQSKECSFYLAKSAVSLTGTIQWDILGDLIKSKGDSDSAGVICRWLMCAKPLGISKLDLFSGDDGLFDIIKTEQKELLKHLRGLPSTDFLLSDDAKRLWQQFQHHLEDLRAIETIDALSVAYPKFESYMSRLALILHCVESFYTRTLPATISGKTMKRAIEMTQFYLNQYRYVLAKISPSQSLTGDILKIRDLLKRMGTLTVTQVKDRFRHLKGKGKEARGIILSYFETLINSGFAQWEISGKKIRTNQDRNQDKSGHNQDSLKPININTLRDTENSKSGQIRAKSGHLKTNNINGLETESGQNNKFNFFSEDIEILETENNNSSSVKDSQENKIVSQENCPDYALNANNGNGLDCPDSVLTCPDETSKPSQDKDFDCPDFCPDFPDNVLICPDEDEYFTHSVSNEIPKVKEKWARLKDGVTVDGMKTRILTDVCQSRYGFIKGRESGFNRYYEVKLSDVEIFEGEEK